MANCRYCSQIVSPEANTCPHCGCPHPVGVPEVKRQRYKYKDLSDLPSVQIMASLSALGFFVGGYFGFKEGGLYDAILYAIVSFIVCGCIGFAITEDQADEKLKPYAAILNLAVVSFLVWLLFW